MTADNGELKSPIPHEPAMLRADIEHTRNEMTDTLGVLLSRVEAKRLYARDAVRDVRVRASEKGRELRRRAHATAPGFVQTAERTAEQLTQQIRGHPSAAAAAAVVVLVLLKLRRRRRQRAK